MTFFRGQKVVCIDDGMKVGTKPRGWRGWFQRYEKAAHNLNKGDIYSVTYVTETRSDDTGVLHECLFVAEAWHFGKRHLPFPAFQFRPVAERKTDISTFTQMLLPQREDA